MAICMGFEKPEVATREQMAMAIMLGRFILRDETGSYYEYRWAIYHLPREPAVEPQV